MRPCGVGQPRLGPDGQFGLVQRRIRVEGLHPIPEHLQQVIRDDVRQLLRLSCGRTRMPTAIRPACHWKCRGFSGTWPISRSIMAALGCGRVALKRRAFPLPPHKSPL